MRMKGLKGVGGVVKEEEEGRQCSLLKPSPGLNHTSFQSGRSAPRLLPCVSAREEREGEKKKGVTERERERG